MIEIEKELKKIINELHELKNAREELAKELDECLALVKSIKEDK